MKKTYHGRSSSVHRFFLAVGRTRFAENFNVDSLHNGSVIDHYPLNRYANEKINGTMPAIKNISTVQQGRTTLF